MRAFVITLCQCRSSQVQKYKCICVWVRRVTRWLSSAWSEEESTHTPWLLTFRSVPIYIFFLLLIFFFFLFSLFLSAVFFLLFQDLICLFEARYFQSSCWSEKKGRVLPTTKQRAPCSCMKSCGLTEELCVLTGRRSCVLLKRLVWAGW